MRERERKGLCCGESSPSLCPNEPATPSRPPFLSLSLPHLLSLAPSFPLTLSPSPPLPHALLSSPSRSLTSFPSRPPFLSFPLPHVLHPTQLLPYRIPPAFPLPSLYLFTILSHSFSLSSLFPSLLLALRISPAFPLPSLYLFTFLSPSHSLSFSPLPFHSLLSHSSSFSSFLFLSHSLLLPIRLPPAFPLPALYLLNFLSSSLYSPSLSSFLSFPSPLCYFLFVQLRPSNSPLFTYSIFSPVPFHLHSLSSFLPLPLTPPSSSPKSCLPSPLSLPIQFSLLSSFTIILCFFPFPLPLSAPSPASTSRLPTPRFLPIQLSLLFPFSLPLSLPFSPLCSFLFVHLPPSHFLLSICSLFSPLPFTIFLCLPSSLSLPLSVPSSSSNSHLPTPLSLRIQFSLLSPFTLILSLLSPPSHPLCSFLFVHIPPCVHIPRFFH